MNRKLGIMMLFLALFVLQSYAQIAGAAVLFLQIEPDGRMSGMGNAGGAVADNASAIFWNPAGLADQRGSEISVTHSNWLPKLTSDLYYDYLVGKHHVEGLGTFGAHVTFLNLGEHERRSPENVALGTFRSYDLSVGASYGFKASKNLSLGTGVRLIYSNLDGGGGDVGTQSTQAGVSAGFDVAALYKADPILMGEEGNVELAFGANLANMGPKIQYSDNGQSDPIPTNLRLGLSAKFNFNQYNSVRVVADANKLLIKSQTNETTGLVESDPFYKAIFSSWQPISINRAPSGQEPQYESLGVLQQMTYGAGLEYWYNNFFAIRGGYFYEHPYNGNRNFLTLGAGIRHNIIGVDFSYIVALEDNHPLAETPRFSLILNI